MPLWSWERLLWLLDVVLRVPPVFLVDAVLGSQPPPLGVLPLWASRDDSDDAPLLTGSATPEPDSLTAAFDAWTARTFATLALRIFGVLLALVVFLLPRDNLLLTYRWLLCVASLLASYSLNTALLEQQDSEELGLISPTHAERFMVGALHFCLQSVLAFILMCTYYGMPRPYLERMVVIAMVTPAVVSLRQPPSAAIRKYIPASVGMLCLGYVLMGIYSRLWYIYCSALLAVRRCRRIVRHYGVHVLLEMEWVRLHIPHVLRVFWLTRALEHAFYLLTERLHVSTDLRQLLDCTVDEIGAVAKDLLVRGCDTMVAVLGMTSVVASLAHYLGCAVQQFLMTEDEEERSFGTVSAILFFILALQTGLTSLEPEKRFVRLYRNACLLVTAVLHFIHNMVNPLLMSLSASRNRSVQRHARALSVCLALVLFPVWFLSHLWRVHHLSTWLLAVSAFCVEVVIKVVISLLIYGLFMLDAYRNTFWEELDDYVYYIRASGNSVEFIFGIFLFFNGAWILLFESGGTIRACMMCVHAYFNIWNQARVGWKVFMRRRQAVNKINSFPEASAEQLRQFEDVCAICYQEMSSARVTRCNHFFHALCLRKWLYIQDRCPLCHTTLVMVDGEAQSSPQHIRVPAVPVATDALLPDTERPVAAPVDAASENPEEVGHYHLRHRRTLRLGLQQALDGNSGGSSSGSGEPLVVAGSSSHSPS